MRNQTLTNRSNYKPKTTDRIGIKGNSNKMSAADKTNSDRIGVIKADSTHAWFSTPLIDDWLNVCQSYYTSRSDATICVYKPLEFFVTINDGERLFCLEFSYDDCTVTVHGRDFWAWLSEDQPILMRLVSNFNKENRCKKEMSNISPKLELEGRNSGTMMKRPVGRALLRKKGNPVDVCDQNGSTTKTSPTLTGKRKGVCPKQIVSPAFHNLGNTCFLNSVLQILFHTPNFYEKLHQLVEEISAVRMDIDLRIQLNQEWIEKFKSNVNVSWKLVYELWDLFRLMANIEVGIQSGSPTEYYALRPYKLLETIEQLNPDFEGNHQQDAHEFLKCLLMNIDNATDELNLYRKEVQARIQDSLSHKSVLLGSRAERDAKVEIIPEPDIQKASLFRSKSGADGWESVSLLGGKRDSNVAMQPELDDELPMSVEEILEDDLLEEIVGDGWTITINKEVEDVDDEIRKIDDDKNTAVSVRKSSRMRKPTEKMLKGLKSKSCIPKVADGEQPDLSVQLRETAMKNVGRTYVEESGNCSALSSPKSGERAKLDESDNMSGSIECGSNVTMKRLSLPGGKNNLDVADRTSPKRFHLSQLESEALARGKSCRVFMNKIDADDSWLQSSNCQGVTSDRVTNLVTDLFQGVMTLKTKCLACLQENKRHEAYEDISVPVREQRRGSGTSPKNGRVAMHELILSMTDEVERLTGDNQYRCDNCDGLVEAERTMLYDSLPDILTLHLKRFASNNSSLTKTLDHVDVPLHLPCIESKCRQKDAAEQHRYELYGIVSHSGSSMVSGHYVAYVKSNVNQSNLSHTPQMSDQNNNGRSPVESKRPRLSRSPIDTYLPNLASSAKNSSPESKPAQNSDEEAVVISDDESNEIPSNGYNGALWYKCDDNIVKILTEEKLQTMLTTSSQQTPYMLFYRKTDVVCSSE